MVDDFFKQESFADIFEVENAEKLLNFNYCLIDANSKRKELSEKKLKQAEPILMCLNDNLQKKNIDSKFKIWGSTVIDMSNSNSDVDFFIYDVNDHLAEVKEIIFNCGFEQKEKKKTIFDN